MYTTPCIAAAALDPHHVPVEALSIRAVEVEQYSVGEGGCAAAVIGASPTGTRAVLLCCRASGEGDSDRFLGADSSLTLLPFLASYRKLQPTLPDLAQSGFSDQSTVWVIIGHST